VNVADLKIELKPGIPEVTDPATGEVVKEAVEAVTWNYGAFCQNVLDFFIIAICLFFIVKAIAKASALRKKKEAEEAAAAPEPEPIPYTWTYDFENADENVNIVGGGAVVDDETPNFGKVFENVSTTVRTNYMTLPDTVLAQSAISKELSIAFWVNANGKAPETYPYAPFFTAYANNTGGNDNSWPMLALQSRGLAQVNCTTWTDFTGADNVEGKNNVYNQSAWEANDPAYNFVENWLADNEWHYYTAVFTEEGLTIYLDGEVNNKWGVGAANPENSLAGLFSNGGDLKHICLGGNQAWNWGDPDAPFRFDDVLITNYVLTPEVIAEIIAAKNYVEPEKEYVFLMMKIFVIFKI
jgi:hypothetical protein